MRATEYVPCVHCNERIRNTTISGEFSDDSDISISAQYTCPSCERTNFFTEKDLLCEPEEYCIACGQKLTSVQDTLAYTLMKDAITSQLKPVLVCSHGGVHEDR